VAELQTITLPALGDFDDIEIIEVLIVSGDVIEAEDPIIILESDKASMEIPSPYSGKVMSVHINVGDRISEGTEIAKLEVAEVKLDEPTPTEAEPAPAESKPAPAESKPAPAESKPAPPVAKAPEAMPTVEVAEAKSPEEHKIVKPASVSPVNQVENRSAKLIHASPSIRRHARELGVNLELVIATGAKGRILKEDVKAFIKASLSAAPTSGGATVSAMPTIDFSKFGEIEPIPLSRIQKISGAHLLRSWVSVPHVTQFDEANITELEAFRKSLKSEAEKKGVRLTPLVFMMKAVVAALQEFPRFNASLENSGERLILKKYFHIGVAVDTPNGLMVPVIRDVDKKGLYDLAAELASTAERARNGKLLPADMQGGCFTISSLGGIGGTNFTPIVNAPEVAILGVAKAKMQPVYEADGSFSAGLILPLALSYDHRVIDGAQGAKFTSFLSQVMTDIRRVLL
jgi:pyruvate dehydrogenase E2 component (dihydrolipoamide acetyltransferase)